MDIQLISAALMKNTLLTIPSLTSILSYEDHIPADHIVWINAMDFIEMPYIVVSTVSGGYLNDTKDLDVDINQQVLGYTSDMARARDLLNAIGKLHKMDIVTTGFEVGDGLVVKPVASIRVRTPLWEVYTIQNVPYYKVGALFRLRYSYYEE